MSSTSRIRSKDPAETDQFIALAAIARLLDADRSSVRRWLRAAGVHAVVFGNGRNAAIRYRREDIDTWMASRVRVS